MKFRNFLGRFTLRQGVKTIGIFDVLIFILDLIFCVISGRGHSFFLMPNPHKFWIFILRILFVDSVRVSAFSYLVREHHVHKSRKIMLMIRVITWNISVLLLILAVFQTKKSGRNFVAMIVLHTIFYVLDIYFILTLYSYQRQTNQEEIEIELRKMKQEQNLEYHIELSDGQTTPEKYEIGAIPSSGEKIRISLDEDAIDLEQIDFERRGANEVESPQIIIYEQKPRFEIGVNPEDIKFEDDYLSKKNEDEFKAKGEHKFNLCKQVYPENVAACEQYTNNDYSI